uniref:Uncharacterized protein n=1 Tax=Elizabethkingia anophelis TaxID=1117645 RepID=A0A455ZFQ1_9FLAO|nr:TPA_exp: hypothetical protein [Elizabethkingia anophelis]DAC76277.1 TPA_exp: hypothetical protein [Elizabethkingia anophelis]
MKKKINSNRKKKQLKSCNSIIKIKRRYISPLVEVTIVEMDIYI